MNNVKFYLLRFFLSIFCNIYLVFKHGVEYLSVLGCQVADEGTARRVFTLLDIVLELLLTDVALICVDFLLFLALQVGDDVVEGAAVEVVDDIVELNLKLVFGLLMLNRLLSSERVRPFG